VKVIFAGDVWSRDRRSDVKNVFYAFGCFVKRTVWEDIRDDHEAQLVFADVFQGRIGTNGLGLRFAADCCADLVAFLEGCAEDCEAYEASGAGEEDKVAACHDRSRIS